MFPNFVNRRIRKVINLLQFQYIILGGLLLFLLRVDDSAKLFDFFSYSFFFDCESNWLSIKSGFSGFLLLAMNHFNHREFKFRHS